MSSSSAPNSGTIFILLPVHNRRAITVRFVECLLRQTDQNYHLVLIDDGSSDGTADAVQKICSQLTVLTGNGQWWWGGSLHQAYLWLKNRGCVADDIVLIVNDDVTFDDDYLQNGRELIEIIPNAQIGSWYLETKTRRLADRGAACDFEKFAITAAQEDKDIVFLSTRGLFLKAQDFLRSGGFHPVKLPHYLSDYEFTFRLKRDLGLQMITSSRIPVFGLDDQSGTLSLRGKSVTQAWKTIFSPRFRDNPIYTARFISMCFPKHFQFRHQKFVWIAIAKRWIFTWPQPLLGLFLIAALFARGCFRILKYFVAFARRTVLRKRYDLETPEPEQK